MCTGYANESKVWGCDAASSQRERMLNSWSRVFEESLEELTSHTHAVPQGYADEPLHALQTTPSKITCP
jgi:hypothetical protein